MKTTKLSYAHIILWPAARMLAGWMGNVKGRCVECGGSGEIDCTCDHGVEVRHECAECRGEGTVSARKLALIPAGYQLALWGEDERVYWAISDNGEAALVTRALLSEAKLQLEPGSDSCARSALAYNLQP